MIAGPRLQMQVAHSKLVPTRWIWKVTKSSNLFESPTKLSQPSRARYRCLAHNITPIGETKMIKTREGSYNYEVKVYSACCTLYCADIRKFQRRCLGFKSINQIEWTRLSCNQS